MDKGRLGVIKSTPHFFTCDVMRKDFLWLFKQAEQLEELEKTAKAWEETARNLTEENMKLHEALEKIALRDSYNKPLYDEYELSYIARQALEVSN